jgi:hypothetical protein
VSQDVSVADRSLDLAEAEAQASKASVWRRALENWKRFAHKLGVVQTRVVMVLFYFLFVLPLGLVLRVVRDPLHFRHPANTNWVPHPQEPQTLESARRQY